MRSRLCAEGRRVHDEPSAGATGRRGGVVVRSYLGGSRTMNSSICLPCGSLLLRWLCRELSEDIRARIAAAKACKAEGEAGGPRDSAPILLLI